ncbi:MAG: hypothetical protein HN600_06520 [Bacteroidetes bacterium]|jgi:hypothetical protein|nr:hypothetical protein [Bacteroidota bacterium]
MAKYWTNKESEQLEDKISIYANKLPIQVHGDFASLKVNDCWSNVKVEGLDSEDYPDYGSIKATLTLVDVEIFNNTNDDFYLDSSNEPLRIVDSNGYSYNPLLDKCPKKYQYLYRDNIGGFITPETRSRGIVAFPKISEGATIARVLLKSNCEVDKKKPSSQLEGFLIKRIADQWLEIVIDKCIKPTSSFQI